MTRFIQQVGTDRQLDDFSGSWIEHSVQRWISDSELQATTVKRRTACVKAFVRWLFRRRLISFNPLERIHVEIKIPKRLPRNLMTDEIRKLIVIKPEELTRTSNDAAFLSSRTEWDKLTARLAVEVLCLTGVRIGELVKIRLADIDHRLRQIRIHGKGNRERHVSFPDIVTSRRLQRYRTAAVAKFSNDAVDT